MTHYTAAHWGIYEVEGSKLSHWSQDPDPNDIGLHALAPELQQIRVRRPAVRKSWLERGPGAAPELRGREPFVEVEWQVALDLVATELARVKATHGNRAIFGGSYGWSSAGRFHHAQSQVHRFLNTALGGYVRSVYSYSAGASAAILPPRASDCSGWPMRWTPLPATTIRDKTEIEDRGNDHDRYDPWHQGL